jgi:hypothetical protein
MQVHEISAGADKLSKNVPAKAPMHPFVRILWVNKWPVIVAVCSLSIFVVMLQEEPWFAGAVVFFWVLVFFVVANLDFNETWLRIAENLLVVLFVCGFLLVALTCGVLFILWVGSQSIAGSGSPHQGGL